MVPNRKAVIQSWASDIAWSVGCLVAGIVLVFVWANVPA